MSETTPLGEIPTADLAEFIARLAEHHGVKYVRDGISALAQTFSRLSGDEGAPDETEKLVIAMRRANVIDGPTMVTLLSRYLNDKFEVESVALASDRGESEDMAPGSVSELKGMFGRATKTVSIEELNRAIGARGAEAGSPV